MENIKVKIVIQGENKEVIREVLTTEDSIDFSLKVASKEAYDEWNKKK